MFLTSSPDNSGYRYMYIEYSPLFQHIQMNMWVVGDLMKIFALQYIAERRNIYYM